MAFWIFTQLYFIILFFEIFINLEKEWKTFLELSFSSFFSWFAWHYLKEEVQDQKLQALYQALDTSEIITVLAQSLLLLIHKTVRLLME